MLYGSIFGGRIMVVVVIEEEVLVCQFVDHDSLHVLTFAVDEVALEVRAGREEVDGGFQADGHAVGGVGIRQRCIGGKDAGAQ